MKRFISVLLAFCLLISCSALLLIGCDDGGGDDDVDKPAPTDKTYMVCLGDSITWGQDGTKGNEGKQMSRPYPSIIKTTLGYDVENLGVPGATICTNVHRTDNSVRPSIQEQLDKIEGSPDIISVMGGANDAGAVQLGDSKSTDTTTLYGGVRYLCQQLKLQYPDSYIFFMTPVKTEHGSAPGSNLEKAAGVIKEVCAEFDIPVYDAFNEVEVSFTEGFSTDGVHLPQKFVTDVLAPNIIDFIRVNYIKSV